MSTLDELIAKEQHRRVRLDRQRRPYREWQQNGGLVPPATEVWCEYCQGFYDRAHTNLHSDDLGTYCPNVSKALNGRRDCDCLDCYCADQLGGEGSLASRITQS